MAKYTIVALSILGLILILGSGYAISSCTKIDPGFVGVSVQKCGVGVDPKPIPTGYYWRSVFCEEVIAYPTNLRTIVLANGDSDKVNDAITVNSKEGLPISVDVSMSFTLDPAKVPDIYKKYRSNIDKIAATFMRQTIREALQGEFSRYTAEQLYADMKEVARANAQAFLSDKLGPEGFMVNQFTFNDVRVPKQVTEAINAKVAMTQDAQKAEAEVRKTEAIAKQREAQAQGEAQAMRLKADAEAYFNKTVAASLTPEYVQYKALERWNGFLPSTMLGDKGIPFLQVGGK